MAWTSYSGLFLAKTCSWRSSPQFSTRIDNAALLVLGTARRQADEALGLTRSDVHKDYRTRLSGVALARCSDRHSEGQMPSDSTGQVWCVCGHLQAQHGHSTRTRTAFMYVATTHVHDHASVQSNTTKGEPLTGGYRSVPCGMTMASPVVCDPTGLVGTKASQREH